MDLTVNKKRNIISTSIPIGDLVSKYLGKSPRTKKPKMKSMVDVDPITGHWVAEIFKPNSNKTSVKVTKQDFTVDKVDLGVSSRATNLKILNLANKKINHKVPKDVEDKAKLKQGLWKMVKYIHQLQNPIPQPLAMVPLSLDVKSLDNQKFLDQVHKERSLSKTFYNWMGEVGEMVNHFTQAYESSTNRSSKLVSTLETKVKLWEGKRDHLEIAIANMEEAFSYGMEKFLSEKIIPDVDSNTLFVEKVNEEWWCTLIDQGIEESEQILKIVACVEEVINNHINCVYNLSIGEVKTGIDEAKMKEYFTRKAQDLKDAKEMVARDCSVIARVQSLIMLSEEQVKMLDTKLEQLQNCKDI